MFLSLLTPVTRLRSLGIFLPLVFAACDRAPENPAPAASAAPSTSVAALPSAAVKKPPACTLGDRKVWSAGASKLAGLSVADLGQGRSAVGLALGFDAHVLVVEPSGEARLVKVTVAKSSLLAKPPQLEEGTRKILRVTPTKVDGEKAFAFVDYRDEYKDKRRRVACGPADASEPWSFFEDVSWLDRGEKPTGEERAKLFSGHDYVRGYGDGKADEAQDKHEYHELRDCRTSSDGSKAWILGSELDAKEAKDAKEGPLEWKSSLVLFTGPKDKEVHLLETPLKGDPPALSLFEVPVSRRFGDGAQLFAARYGSSLRVGLIGKDKRLKGAVETYPGFPTIPSAAEDGEDIVVVTSIAKEKGDFALRGLRISKTQKLPKGLVDINTHAGEAAELPSHSETDPTFLRDSKGRRWLAFIEGKRGQGNLEIVPIDEYFHPLGRRFSLGEDKKFAAEVRLLPLADGRILLVSLRESGDGVEVVSEELGCEIVKD